jgi:hypothetical protein
MVIYNITRDQIDANLGRINSYPTYPLPYRFFYFIDPDGNTSITDYVSLDFGVTGTPASVDDGYIPEPLYS